MSDHVKSLNQSAITAMRQSRTNDAKRDLEQAMNALQSGGVDPTAIPELLAVTHNNLGCLAKREKKYESAIHHLSEACKLERQTRGKAAAATLLNLSTVFSAIGNTEKAVELAEACVNNVPADQPQTKVTALHNLAMAELAVGGKVARDCARAHLTEALALATKALGAEHATTTIIGQRLEALGSGRQVSPKSDERAAAARALATLSVPSPVRRQKPEDVMKGALFTNNNDDDTQSKSKQHEPQQEHEGGLPQDSPHESSTSVPQDGVALGATTGSPASSNANIVPLGVSASSGSHLGGSQQQQQQQHYAHTQIQQQHHVPNQRHLRRLEMRNRTPVEEPSFTRFATDLRDKPPPLPLTFRDVKAEIKIKKDAAARAAAAAEIHAGGDRTGIRSMTDGSSLLPFHHASEKRQAKVAYEKHEEEAYMQLRRKQREAKEREMERQHRAAVLVASKRNQAAKTIQRFYRRHMTAGRLEERQARLREEISQKAKKVTGFASRWLHRTAGKRLVARMQSVHDPQIIEDAGLCIQRAWRRFNSLRETAERVEQSTSVTQQMLQLERRTFAAMQLQQWIRQRQAIQKRKYLHSNKYVDFAVKIQRWMRLIFKKKKETVQMIVARRRQGNAATKIQAAWRRYAATIRVAMLRLQAKVQALKNKDRNAVLLMQRIGRGGKIRRRLFDARRQFLAQTEKQRRALFAVEDESPFRAGGQPSSSAVAVVAESPTTTSRYMEEVEADEARRKQISRRFEEDCRDMYVNVVVNEQAKRHQDLHNQFGSRKEYDLRWGQESFQRQQEFRGKMMIRSAIRIQRIFRRWRKTRDPDRFHVIRNKCRAEHERRELVKEEEKLSRFLNRQKNDLAKPIREEKLALQQEINELQPTVEDAVFRPRSHEQRQQVREELKAMKARIKRDEIVRDQMLDQTY